jgi:hypothetical protein
VRRFAAPALACAAAHVLAAISMVTVLRPGTEAEPDVASRVRWITDHPALWRAGWASWIVAAGTLVWFCVFWARRAAPARRAIAIVACALGAAFDVGGQVLYLAALPEGIEWAQPLGTLLTAAVANGLYTASFATLLVSTSQGGATRAIGWTVVVAGVTMTASTIAGAVPGTIVATAVIVLALPVLCLRVGRAPSG